MTEKGAQRSSQSIYTILADDHNAHCMTEAMLDIGWASLAPEHKAELFDFWIDEAVDVLSQSETLRAEFQINSSRFLSEMERLHQSPFAGLTSGGR